MKELSGDVCRVWTCFGWLHLSEKSSEVIRLVQASAYEACNCMCTPLHMSKILETSKKKSRPCLIHKASRCTADRLAKTSVFYLSLSTKHKDLTRNLCVFIFYFTGSMAKVVCFYFCYIKDDRLRKN